MRVPFPVLQLLEISPTAVSSYAIFIIQWARLQRSLRLLSVTSSHLKGVTAPTKKPCLLGMEIAQWGFGDTERTLWPSRQEDRRKSLTFSGREGSTSLRKEGRRHVGAVARTECSPGGHTPGAARRFLTGPSGHAWHFPVLPWVCTLLRSSFTPRITLTFFILSSNTFSLSTPNYSALWPQIISCAWYWGQGIQ